MKMIPRSPVGIAFLLWRLWRRLPPAQRRQVLDLARKHGAARLKLRKTGIR